MISLAVVFSRVSRRMVGGKDAQTTNVWGFSLKVYPTNSPFESFLTYQREFSSHSIC